MATVATNVPDIIQVGPGLSVRGGVSTVERLIYDYVGAKLTVRHVTTMEDGPLPMKLWVFFKAVRELRVALADPQPFVVHIHLASRGSTLRKTILAWMTLRAHRPLVVHAHGSTFDEFFDTLPKFVQRTFSRTFSRADRFVVLSSQWRDFYVNRCGLPRERVAVLINPTPLPPVLPDRSARECVQFVFLGRIGARKGPFDLLRAFRALPPAVRERARLVFAGDGEVEALRRAARDLGSAVTVHSWLDRAQLAALLAASDAFVLPSYHEGVPMALLEAMAHGLPVIATPVGGIPDAMTANVEGILVVPGDESALTGALRRLIEDESLRLEMGRAARLRAEGFDVTGYTQRLLHIYRQLLTDGAMRTSS